MAQTTTVRNIINAVSQAISNLTDGGFLCSGEAFEIAQKIADAAVEKENPELTANDKRRASLSILHDAYPTAREIIASQLIGMTFEQVVETIQDAKERFQGTRELAITPRPTLAYTGECEPLEPWNLYSNVLHAENAAKDARSQGNWTASDATLLNGIERAHQMLHFICQREINVADITGQPFTGRIAYQTRPVPLSELAN